MNKFCKSVGSPALALCLSLGLSLVLTAGVSPLFAQGKSRIAPMSLYQAMLKGNEQTGWVQFRNYNGKQLIYFTALQTMHCRLKEIRYSINSDVLDKRFDLVKCNPQNPFSMPPNTGLQDILVSVALGTAKKVVVQVVWEDGVESKTMRYEPCKDVGDQTCAWPLE